MRWYVAGLHVPHIPLRLSWDPHAAAYRLLLDGALHLEATHTLDGVAMYELVFWQATLNAAVASASASIENRLAVKRRWRFDEHARAERARVEAERRARPVVA